MYIYGMASEDGNKYASFAVKAIFAHLDVQVTCGVKCDVLDQVLILMGASIAAASVQANVITSGSGDWR